MTDRVLKLAKATMAFFYSTVFVYPLLATVQRNEVTTWLATIFQTNQLSFVPRYICILLFSIPMVQSFCGMLVIGGMILFSLIRFLTALPKIRNLPYLMRKYRELMIWNDYFNRYLISIALPPFIFFGCLITVLGNYGTIRGRGVLHPVQYTILPETSMIGFGCMHGLLPFATATNDLSVSLMERMRKTKGRLAQRIVRSFRPLGFSSGGADLLTRESKASVFSFIVDNTITMLLAF